MRLILLTCKVHKSLHNYWQQGEAYIKRNYYVTSEIDDTLDYQLMSSIATKDLDKNSSISVWIADRKITYYD